MGHRTITCLLTAIAVCGGASLATAQNSNTVGTGSASDSNGTVGSAGSGSAGDTSASTVGTAGTSTGEDGETASTLGSAGSAAGGDKNTSRTNIHGNENNLHGKSQAKAMDQGGTWSKSKTQTKAKQGEELSTRTKTMSHEAGGPPSKSTSSSTFDVE